MLRWVTGVLAWVAHGEKGPPFGVSPLVEMLMWAAWGAVVTAAVMAAVDDHKRRAAAAAVPVEARCEE